MLMLRYRDAPRVQNATKIPARRTVGAKANILRSKKEKNLRTAVRILKRQSRGDSPDCPSLSGETPEKRTPALEKITAKKIVNLILFRFKTKKNVLELQWAF